MFDLHTHVGTVHVKKSCQYRLPFLRFHVNRFTVPVPFYRSVHRFTVASTDYRESGDSGRGSRDPKACEV